MSFESDFFAKKRLVVERLESFGFIKSQDGYDYVEKIMNEAFEVHIHIDQEGNPSGRVVDCDLGEEYVALHVTQATGAFVGQVREAYQGILDRIVETCFEAQLFAKGQTNRLVDYIASTWQDPMDHPFKKFPHYASYRVGGKWYALIFPLKMSKLGQFPSEIAERDVEVINIKVNPDDMEGLLKQDGIYPSYHMSKKNWISIVLDDGLADDVLWELLAKSRQLVNPNRLANSDGPDYWLIPANPKYYDIDAEFAENKVIDWTQKASIKKGDYVGIYMTAPTRALRYLCRVLEADIRNDGYRDHPNIQKLMRIERIKSFSEEVYTADILRDYGVTNIRGPRRMTPDLRLTLQKDIEGL
ncbi:MmcQ/YjbR family DNA-binding protein [Streptococcus saliviloxodontae]|uniref:DNA-binding protein (MmcQ/YjbR family) n=1 Tax=Streptococcus saliviloxodontae TaxID=1349416 RepID=A0ABS2PKA3_9STRE|nr:MmcQ/YjbR family DNA-binding protein [Streptococcus saliviloxodontae]MBM7635521.1 putative DNA-binding protein (MmcQ/YjbR family) [Streptococcus saliviloxodontae]